jgi:hypothetical protein
MPVGVHKKIMEIK